MKAIKPDMRNISQEAIDKFKMHEASPIDSFEPVRITGKTTIYAPRYAIFYWLMRLMPYKMHAAIAKNKILNKILWKEECLF